MKVEPRGGVKNTLKTAGFLNIEDFEGETMTISTVLLEQAFKVIKTLNKDMGEGDMQDYINVGIAHKPELSNNVGTFFIFLDSKKTLAYAIAGADEG